ncbi:MAG: glutathione S-transferase family protein [Polyangia bacterium]
MKLYSVPPSPNSKRVRVCAAELGIPVEVANLDFAKGQQRSPDYLALNPMGKVPTLSDGSFVLWESAAILHYLAAQRPGALWPAELRAQSDALRWMFFCACHLDAHFGTLVVERIFKPRNLGPDPTLVANAVENLGRYLAIVERQLIGREYVTGAFGIVDIALGCTIEAAPALQLDLAPYGNVRAWLARLQARPSWKA